MKKDESTKKFGLRVNLLNSGESEILYLTVYIKRKEEMYVKVV